jgi:hypothetical protein
MPSIVTCPLPASRTIWYNKSGASVPLAHAANALTNQRRDFTHSGKRIRPSKDGLISAEPLTASPLGSAENPECERLCVVVLPPQEWGNTATRVEGWRATSEVGRV